LDFRATAESRLWRIAATRIKIPPSPRDRFIGATHSKNQFKSTQQQNHMKMKLTLVPAILIAGAVTLIAVTGARTNAKTARDDGQHLEGSWLVAATVTDDPTLIRALLTCTPNGEVVETPSVPLAVSTGHGGWIRTGNREFAITVMYLHRNEQGELVGTSRVRSVFKVNEALTQGGGRFQTEVFDLEGKMTGSFQGTAQATRIEVAPLN